MLIISFSMLTGILAVLFAGVSLIMMLVILIQRPKGGGLSGAFGGSGGGSANAAFGAKTGDVLTWFTVGCFVLFLTLAMGLTWTVHADVNAAKALKQSGTLEASTQTTAEDDATESTPKPTETAKTTKTSETSASSSIDTEPATDPVKAVEEAEAHEAAEKAVEQTQAVGEETSAP